jgi:predicted O-linked N-acetylglucosamine transferase (SPINDLY family)
MNPIAQLLHEAIAAHQARRFADAQRLYKRVLKAAPDHPEALQLLGIVLLEQGRNTDALPILRHAAERSPHSTVSHLQLGNAYAALGRVDEAIRCYQTACRLRSDSGDAWFNLGTVLDQTGRRADALAAFDRALAITPDHPGYRNNRALCLKFLGRPDDAEKDLREALHVAPDFVAGWENLGDLLRERERFGDATDAYRRGLALAPQRADIAGSLYWVVRQTCEWENLGALESALGDAIRKAPREAVPPISPFAALVLPLSAAQLGSLAAGHARQLEQRARHQCPATKPARAARGPRPQRLVVGYVSADFHDHATAHLVAGLFEAHDRARFDIRLYSHGPDDAGAYRRRLVDAVDAFMDIAPAGNCQAAQRIRDDGVHILLDLKGYTTDARPELFALRPAPIQVNYLGFPGTMGAAWYDWYVTDPVCSPPGSEAHFREGLVYLPDCYQPNDDRQCIADVAPDRAACGLPENAFVYCCFNQSYKIEPQLFDVWMRILERVPESVLWLYRKYAEAEVNLRREAERRGIDPQRLIFASRLPKAEHLARHRHADLFLDTRRYNAHTTASDALWAGVPLITCPGETFASRVGASLLHAAGLADLVMPDMQAYEETAVRLAQRPDEIAALKARLQANRLTHPLFDTERYARNLERAFDAMWEAYARGQKPRAIHVPTS